MLSQRYPNMADFAIIGWTQLHYDHVSWPWDGMAQTFSYSSLQISVWFFAFALSVLPSTNSAYFPSDTRPPLLRPLAEMWTLRGSGFLRWGFTSEALKSSTIAPSSLATSALPYASQLITLPLVSQTLYIHLTTNYTIWIPQTSTNRTNPKNHASSPSNIRNLAPV